MNELRPGFQASRGLRLYTAVALLACCGPVASAPSEADPLFADDTVLEVRIEAPFDRLTDERPQHKDLDGKFSYADSQGNVSVLDVGVRVRGKLRSTSETCSFPPLRLDFVKSQVAGTLFEGQDKLKLVTHCRNRAVRYEQSLLAEYLAYRIYNQLTDASFRVRLLHATYVPTDGGSDLESYAFIIEDKHRFAHRIGIKKPDVNRVRVVDLNAAELNLSSVFQYFIGNTDFSPIAAAPGEACCHNQVLFSRKGNAYLSVPYDFDQSGLVNAPYAAPDPKFDLDSPRDRLYRGRCVNNDHLPATLALFREKRTAIETLVENQEGLRPSTRKQMLDFIEDFYKTIEDPDRVTKYIVNRCI
jgi:hypothetical protein